MRITARSARNLERKITVSFSKLKSVYHEKNSPVSYNRMAGGQKPIFKHEAQVKVVTLTYIHQEDLECSGESLNVSGRLFLYLSLTSDLFAVGVTHFGPIDQ